jgi:hypothetical protein
MGLQLKQLIIVGICVVFNLSCTNNYSIVGNWGSLDTTNHYSELYFVNNSIRIYTEAAGLIPSQTFKVHKDSLFTNIISYKKKWINPDSLILVSESTTMYLKRIHTGFKLSDYENESDSDSFSNAFFNRMNKRKGKE